MTSTRPVVGAMPDTSSAAGRRYRWWHAAAVGVAANLVNALPAGYNGDPAFYEELRTPPGAPPSWLFAPVWAVNNVLTLWSNLRIANLPVGTPGRRTALGAEGATWVLFASFSGLYFGLRSPALGALDTVACLATTTRGVLATARLDRAAGWALAPRLLWLAYASYVSVASAAMNPGPRSREAR